MREPNSGIHVDSRTFFIYGLFDLDVNDIRYVGVTTKPKQRLRQHILNAKTKPRTSKDRWIREVLMGGRSPSMLILEQCTAADYAAREIYWISAHQSLGLTNCTRGGEWKPGVMAMSENQRRASRERLLRLLSDPAFTAARLEGLRGSTKSAQWKEKVREARKRYQITEETRKKIADTLTGRKLSLETIAKRTLKQRGQKRSEEQKRRMSACQMGRRRTAEQREAQSRRMRGHKQSEETKRKRSLSLQGRKRPPEVIARIVQTKRLLSEKDNVRNGNISKAKQLRESGYSFQAIADILGKSIGAAFRHCIDIK